MSGIATAVIGSAVIGGVVASKGQKAAAAAADRAADQNAYQGEIATDQYDDYKQYYRPLEHQFIKDAQNADSPEAYQNAASAAQSSVSTQLGLARERLSRTPGLDPSSPAAQAAAATMELKGAALGATEQNKARQQVKDMAYAKKQDAVAMGKGMASSAAAGLASAAAGANAQAQSAALRAGQEGAGAGALFSGVVNGLSKMNFGAGGGSGGQLASVPQAPANMDWGSMGAAYGPV
jgi:hypothetical protein